MASLVLHGGLVHTLDPARPRAEAVAVSGGRVVAIGSRAEARAAAPHAREVDLGGRCVVPGFNDAHMHLWKIGHMLTSLVDLRSVTSLRELTEKLRTFAAARPAGAWIVGRGYNEAALAEKRSPDRDDLDAALPDRRVFLTRTCGHIGVASSAALASAGVDHETAPPPGGAIDRDARGRPTGILHETAMGLVNHQIGEPEAEEYAEMVQAASAKMVKLGITSVTDAGVTPRLLDVYRNLDASGSLQLRVNAMALRRTLSGGDTMPLPERTVTPRLRIDTVKLLVDGGLSGGTAALSMPYRHADDCGLMRVSGEELLELAREAHAVGLRVGAHAIGDRAIDEILNCYAAMLSERPGPAPRIEHFGLPSPAQLKRAKALGVIAVPQTIFLASLGVNFRKYLPDALLPQCYPVRSMIDAGLIVALSSDAPVVREEAPLAGFQAALVRKDAEGVVIVESERITAAEALFAYTVGGAQASGDDADRGRLSPGHVGDLVVLDRDPLATPPEEIGRIAVTMTVLDGTIVHEA